MFCGQCGTENSNNEIYCKNCGRLIQENYMQMENDQVQQRYDNLQGQNVYYQDDEKYQQMLKNKNMQFAILSIIIPIIAIMVLIFGNISAVLWAAAIGLGIAAAERGKVANKSLCRIGLILTFVVFVLGIISVVFYNIKVNSPHENKVKDINIVEQIELGSTLEEANEIIGVKGDLINEEKNIYSWQIEENYSLEIWYQDEIAIKIELIIDKMVLRDSRLDFPKHKKLERSMAGADSYDEVVVCLENIEGILISKVRGENGYIWVDKDGDCIKGYFSSFNNRNAGVFLNSKHLE